MFSLFHKDAATAASHKPGDPSRTTAQQSENASTAGAVQARVAAVIQPGSEAPAAGFFPPALPTDVVLPTPANVTEAAGVGSPARLDSGFRVARVGSENPDVPQARAGGEAPLPSPVIPCEEDDAEAFLQDGEGLSRDTEAIGQESEAPVRYAAGRKPSPGRQLRSPEEAKRRVYTPQQRLMLLDTWRRSGLPALDFASLVGISKHTLYAWKQLFERQGPAGLLDQPRRSAGGEPLAGADQADHLDAERAASGMGLPADQRPVGPWPRAAGQCFGRGSRAARGGL